MRAMKDSGIEWIGEIPKVWHSCKVKHVSSLNGRIGWQGLTSNEYMECGPFLITGTDFKEGKINWENCVHISLERYEEAKQIQIRNGDLLITKDGTIGKVAIVNDLSDKASLNSGVLLIRPLNDEKYVVRFKYYILISEIFWKWYESTKTGNSTILHLYQEKFKEFSYPLPPLPEQTRIATFLDNKCTAIDAAIEKQRASIDKLKEYRQAVITEAVTKGLNPDVPMKDSGVEWIGEIPKGWEILRIKRVFKERKESNENPNELLLSLFSHIGVRPRSEMEEKGNKSITVMSYSVVKKGDIVVNKLLAWMGAIGMSDYDGVTSPDYDIYTPISESVHVPYYHYIFRSANFKNECYRNGKGIMMMRLRTYPQEFKNIRIPFPPKNEQEKIVNYIDKKCTAIDEAVSRKEKLIEKLEEYKKSLIYEAVTGKIEVPELSA